MALRGLKQPWHSYDEAHMNEHMAEHTIKWKKFAFTWFDLEMTYLLWQSSSDFQVVCQNRIIKWLESVGETTWKELWVVTWFRNIHDVVPIPWYDLCYQAQNLVYMYSLWLVDTLDRDLVDMTRDTTVRNIWRVWRKLDWDIPIFRSLIWMHDEIPLNAADDIRTDYLWKKPLAKEILKAWKKYWLKLNDIALRWELESV